MSGGDRCDGDGLINPALFPVKSAEFCESEIVEAASGLRAMGVGTLSEVLDVKAEWSKLPGCYEAPEQGLVYALMDPAVVSAEELKSVLGRAADRLDVYAAALKGVQARLSSLEARAVAFRNRVKDGVWVDRSEARGASVRDLFWGAVDWVPGIDEDKVKVYWKEDSGTVEENNALLEEFSGILADVSAAAAECANGINGLLTRVSPGKVEALPAEAFHNPAQPMPWGRPATEQRNCPESVGHGVYEFGKSTLEGAGQLLLGYNPRTGGFFEVESYGQAWGGLANLAVSVAVVAVPGTDLYAVAGLPGSEWIKERQKVVRETLLSFVSYDPSRPDDPWHKWKEDPVAAFTEGALNVGTCFIPAGQVAGVLKAGSAGARVAKFAAGVAEMAVPAGSWLVKGGVHAIPVLRSVLGKVDDVVGAVAQRPVVSLKSSVLGVALRAVDVAGAVPVSKPVSAALFDGGAGGSRSAGVGVSGSRSVGSGVLDPVSRVSGGSRPGGAGLGQGMAVVGRADRVPGVGSWVDGVDGRPGPDGVRPSSEAGGGSGASSRAESQDGAGTRLESETNPHPEVHDGTSTRPDNIDTAGRGDDVGADGGDFSADRPGADRTPEGVGDEAAAGAQASSGGNHTGLALAEIREAIGGINPGYDPRNPANGFATNCGSTAAALFDRLNGGRLAEAPTGTLDIAQMEARTGLPQTPVSGPDQIEATLREMGAGSHCVVGLDRVDGPGHWFNAYFDGEQVWVLDAQTGVSTKWPPFEPSASRWDMSVDPARVVADPVPGNVEPRQLTPETDLAPGGVDRPAGSGREAAVAFSESAVPPEKLDRIRRTERVQEYRSERARDQLAEAEKLGDDAQIKKTEAELKFLDEVFPDIIDGKCFDLANQHRYDVSELHMTRAEGTAKSSGKGSGLTRVDGVSFGEPNEVVSRKKTQLAKVLDSTAIGYLKELIGKYGTKKGVTVADTPSNRSDLLNAGIDPNDLIGRQLKGRRMLEVPIQDAPPSVEVLRYAEKHKVVIRDVELGEWYLTKVDGRSVPAYQLPGKDVEVFSDV